MQENLLPFILFVIAMTGTPGPGNLTMMAIGQTTGFRSAIPFLIGTAIGHFCLDTLVACGLGGVFAYSPLARTVLAVCGTAYIVYLAIKILRMNTLKPKEAPKRFTIWEGLVLHPLSPKSWAMTVAAFSQFVDPANLTATDVLIFVGCFFMGLAVFHSLWCLAGSWLMRVMQSPPVRHCLNFSMVALMLGATFYAMIGTFGQGLEKVVH